MVPEHCALINHPIQNLNVDKYNNKTKIGQILFFVNKCKSLIHSVSPRACYGVNQFKHLVDMYHIWMLAYTIQRNVLSNFKRS